MVLAQPTFTRGSFGVFSDSKSLFPLILAYFKYFYILYFLSNLFFWGVKISLLAFLHSSDYLIILKDFLRYFCLFFYHQIYYPRYSKPFFFEMCFKTKIRRWPLKVKSINFFLFWWKCSKIKCGPLFRGCKKFAIYSLNLFFSGAFCIKLNYNTKNRKRKRLHNFRANFLSMKWRGSFGHEYKKILDLWLLLLSNAKL